MLEKEIETTIVFSGYIGIMETGFGVYCDYIGILQRSSRPP